MPVHPFAPVYDGNSRVLILGSFPAVKSRETQFYYGHPQNRFWKVTANLFGCDVPVTVQEKREMLLQNRVAVWDTLASCDITGSSDATIRNPVANDISRIIEEADIRLVCFNGKKSADIFEKYSPAKCKLPSATLPSTSPANAQYSLERLLLSWRKILSPYLYQ